MQEDKLTTIPITDERYPKEWKDLPNAPKTLQCYGDTALLLKRKLTVVGSRQTPISALKTGGKIVEKLSQAFVIVTGTADGGDVTAIESALNVGKVICVLAGGFSALPQNLLPLLKKVGEKGLLLSPYPFDTPVRSYSYEYRNKLLAYLGEGTLVLGAGKKSGALITAKYAKQAQKPVFALPYNPGAFAGEGCNALIKTGAYLTESADDVCEVFHLPIGQEQPAPKLSADEEKVAIALKELSQAHVSELALKTRIPVFKLRAVLSSLEIKGKAVNLGGNRFSPA